MAERGDTSIRPERVSPPVTEQLRVRSKARKTRGKQHFKMS